MFVLTLIISGTHQERVDQKQRQTSQWIVVL